MPDAGEQFRRQVLTTETARGEPRGKPRFRNPEISRVTPVEFSRVHAVLDSSETVHTPLCMVPIAFSSSSEGANSRLHKPLAQYSIFMNEPSYLVFSSSGTPPDHLTVTAQQSTS